MEVKFDLGPLLLQNGSILISPAPMPQDPTAQSLHDRYDSPKTLLPEVKNPFLFLRTRELFLLLFPSPISISAPLGLTPTLRVSAWCPWEEHIPGCQEHTTRAQIPVLSVSLS